MPTSASRSLYIQSPAQEVHMQIGILNELPAKSLLSIASNCSRAKSQALRASLAFRK
jgi:hypothetical protein